MIRDISAGAFYRYSYTGKISVFTWMHLSTILWVRPSDFFLALLILVKNKNKKNQTRGSQQILFFPFHTPYMILHQRIKLKRWPVCSLTV